MTDFTPKARWGPAFKKIGTVTAMLVLGAAVASSQPVRNTSYVLPSGERVQRYEGDLEASVDTVWQTLTTSAGLRSFLAPTTWMDLRLGGHWEASYQAGAKRGDPDNIINEVLSYVPREMLAVRVVQAARGFVHPEIVKQVWTVYQLQPVGERRTKLTVSMIGWPSGPAADSVYRFFDRGNAYTMSELQKRFVTGPHVW